MRERYEKILKLKGVKNADVSRATNISPATISEWRKGKYELNLERIILIAEYLGVSLDYLVLGKENESSEALLLYRELNEEGKEKAAEYIRFLLSQGYKKSNSARMVEGA